LARPPRGQKPPDSVIVTRGVQERPRASRPPAIKKKKEASRGAPFTRNRRVAPSGCFLRWEIPPGDGREEEPRDIQYPAVSARPRSPLASVPRTRRALLERWRVVSARDKGAGDGCWLRCRIAAAAPRAFQRFPDCERGYPMPGSCWVHTARTARPPDHAPRASEQCALPSSTPHSPWRARSSCSRISRHQDAKWATRLPCTVYSVWSR